MKRTTFAKWHIPNIHRVIQAISGSDVQVCPNSTEGRWIGTDRFFLFLTRSAMTWFELNLPAGIYNLQGFDPEMNTQYRNMMTMFPAEYVFDSTDTERTKRALSNVDEYYDNIRYSLVRPVETMSIGNTLKN